MTLKATVSAVAVEARVQDVHGDELVSLAAPDHEAAEESATFPPVRSAVATVTNVRALLTGTQYDLSVEEGFEKV